MASPYLKAPYAGSPDVPAVAYSLGRPMRVLLGVNPNAGGGKGARYRDALDQYVRRNGGTSRLPPHIETYHTFETLADSNARIGHIRETIAQNRPDAVVVAGGDGTVADFAEAIQDLIEAPRPFLVAGPVGTAFDIARCSGVPQKAAWLFDWMKWAKPNPLPLAHVRFNGEDTAYPMVHSLSIGLSGEVFAAMEEAKREHPGLPSWRYLGILAPRLTHAPSYDLSVNDGALMRCGEMLCGIVPRMMGTAGVALPLPLYGAGLFALPVNDDVRAGFAGSYRRIWPALQPFIEGLWRGLKVAYVDDSLMRDVTPLTRLSPDRQFQFPSGSEVHLRITKPGSNGTEPLGIHCALDGETMPDVGPVHQVDMDLPVPTLQTLAHRWSYFDMRSSMMASAALLAAGG